MMRAVVLIALFWAVPAQAVTLKEVLDVADQRSVHRRLSVEQRERAATEYGQAWATLLPSLNVNAGWTHNQYEVIAAFGERELVIQPKNQFDATMRFELPLLDV